MTEITRYDEDSYARTAQKYGLIGGAVGLSALIANEVFSLTNFEGNILAVATPAAIGATVAITAKAIQEAYAPIKAMANWKV